MKQSKTGSDKRKVVLEGCNGEWAQKHYFPALLEEAYREEIELWAIDIKPRVRIDNSFKNLWTSCEKYNKVHYLNKIKDKELYEHLSDIDYVFVIVPDKYHSEVAEGWINRLSPNGKIFIEKPLDAFVRSAIKLRRKIIKEKKKEAIYCFDHYLASISTFLEKKEEYLKTIGKIERIEFQILETSSIPISRADTLNKGIVFDLFPHILVVISAILLQSSESLEQKLQNIKVLKVIGAQVPKALIIGETFAKIDFIVREIKIEAMVGKYTGVCDSKFMKIYGLNGLAEFNFLERKFSIIDYQNNKKINTRLNQKHVKNFLNKVLSGKNPLLVPGVLSLDTALEILLILDEVKMRIDRINKYKPGSSVEEILGEAYKN